MSMTPFATTLSDYIKAGYPAIAVTTHEEERLLRDLRMLKEVGWSFASWSAVRGWRDPEGKAIQGTTAGATAPTAALEVESWSAAIESLSRDLARREELTRRGLARAARFTWARTAELTLKAYEDAMVGNGREEGGPSSGRWRRGTRAAP